MSEKNRELHEYHPINTVIKHLRSAIFSAKQVNNGNLLRVLRESLKEAEAEKEGLIRGRRTLTITRG